MALYDLHVHTSNYSPCGRSSAKVFQNSDAHIVDTLGRYYNDIPVLLKNVNQLIVTNQAIRKTTVLN
jgi:hypothetical protein